MRWRIHLRYRGTAYCGWQRQPEDPSVQQTLEEAFSMILRQPVEITGCGRTDTGVHANFYVAHTDVDAIEPNEKLVYQINAVLPEDIAITEIVLAHPEFHARFDAMERQYRYYLHFTKDPFRNDRSFYFQAHHLLDQEAMHAAASLLLTYNHFQPFCKTGSDAEHFKCLMQSSAWSFHKDEAVYTIRANRFLRGMVRLVVGACINVGLGKVSLDELKNALDQQIALPHAWSVPASGLFLDAVVYPDDSTVSTERA